MTEQSIVRRRILRSGAAPLAGLAAGVLAQLVCTVMIYQFAIDFTCVGRADAGFCKAIGAMPAQAVSLLAFGALYALARPQALAPLLASSARPAVWRPLAALQLTGFALILAPAPLAALWDVDLLRIAPPFW